MCGKPTPDYPEAIKIDRTLFILKKDYSYEWPMDLENPGSNDPAIVCNRITIEKGFRWDGASVPKAFWWLGFKPDGPHRAAALVHDFIYIHKGKLPEKSFQADYNGVGWHRQSGSFSRKDSDRLFGRMMRESGVKKTRRRLMKFAVSWFGWIYWQDGPDVMKGTLLKTILVILFAILFYKLVLSSFSENSITDAAKDIPAIQYRVNQFPKALNRHQV